MGKKIGKTGMGGAGKLKEDGQIKKELWGGDHAEKGLGAVVLQGVHHRGAASSPAAHTQHNLLIADPRSQHEEGIAPPAKSSQN